MKVLIVDDEKDNLDALRRLLRKEFEVVTASSGEEAIKLLADPALKNLDVIVSDQRMPGMQGSEFLEKVSTMDLFATRILLTGFSDIDAVVDAVNRGQIWRYIAKPWEPDEFLLTMKLAAERSQMSRNLSLSRTELEKALIELRAKDWSREGLLLLLLHEFRTAPQILSAIRDLNDNDGESRNRFLENLENRFSLLSQEITGLLEEEKKTSSLPKQNIVFTDFMEKFCQSLNLPLSYNKTTEAKPVILSHAESLKVCLEHFTKLPRSNHLGLPLEVSLDFDPSTTQDLFLIFSIAASPDKTIPLPMGLKQVSQDPKLVWPLLLEPFVGMENFELHSKGLRLESARFVRQLSSLGAKLAFQINPKSGIVELILAFKLAT